MNNLQLRASFTPETIRAMEEARAAAFAQKQEAEKEALLWKDEYKLVEISPHQFAYQSISPEMTVHNLCPSCFERNIKSSIKQAANPPLRMNCPRCGTNVRLPEEPVKVEESPKEP